MIEFDRVSFSYDATPLFRDLTWSIDPSTQGGMHFILSPSGYGKSTLFKLILGVLEPDAGKVRVDDATRMAYVPQEPVLFDHLSIYDNATFFKNIKARKDEFDPVLFEEVQKSLNIADELLHSSQKISQLSGGQKRKISLLKALSLHPKVLLLDEPSTGLDASVKIELLTQIQSLADRYGVLVLYITHHFEETRLIGDTVHFLMKSNDGHIEAISSQNVMDFINQPPSLEAAYLVDYPDARIQRGRLENGEFIPDPQGAFYHRKKNIITQIFGPNGQLIEQTFYQKS